MFIEELDARVTRALASSVTPMHSKCTPLAFSNFLALVFFSQHSKIPRNLLLFLRFSNLPLTKTSLENMLLKQ